MADIRSRTREIYGLEQLSGKNTLIDLVFRAHKINGLHGTVAGAVVAART